MSKYFRIEKEEEIKISEVVERESKEVESLGKRIEELEKSSKLSSEIYSLQRKVKDLKYRSLCLEHITKILGDISIEPSRLEALITCLDVSLCRYKRVCLKEETLKGIYEISTLFPELSSEAIKEIGKEYISDLFKDYDLTTELALMIRKEGSSDETFDKFMDLTKSYAEVLEKKYKDEAWKLEIYYGYYSHSFITHFKKFMVDHHISLEQMTSSLVSPMLILEDELKLKEISSKARECFMVCQPISFQMTEDYLMGDYDLERFSEQPFYYISIYGKEIPTTFTKTEFLESLTKKSVLKK